MVEHTLEERLAALEQKHRGTRRLFWLTSALLVIMGVAIFEAYREKSDLDRYGLETTGGVLIQDEAEHHLASLGRQPQDGRPYFKFLDENHHFRMFMALRKSGPGLEFQDAEGRIRVRLAVDDDGGRIEILDAEGKAVWSAP